MSPKQSRKASTAAAAAAAAAAAEQPENLETVRDILFGGHMRAVEGRIARIEERLVREQQAMRAETEKALATIESFARKELDALGEKLKGERAKRTEDLKALGAELKDALKSLDRRLAQLDEATGRADADLRTQLLEQQQTTATNLAELGDRLTAELRAAEQSLRAEKADIGSLLAIFSEVAVKLSEELQVPPDA